MPTPTNRTPVHVVYGGAHLYSADTPQKLGKIALRSLQTYAGDVQEFAAAFGLDEDKKLLQSIYKKTVDKLQSEPVEDLRIDFEDGYGFRPNEEEDSDARRASGELAKAFAKTSVTSFCGFRIKSLAPETRDRAVRTFNIFFENFLSKTKNKIPENFVVTLPKVSHRDEVSELCRRIARVEHDAHLAPGSIGMEIIAEDLPLRRQLASSRFLNIHLFLFIWASHRNSPDREKAQRLSPTSCLFPPPR